MFITTAALFLALSNQFQSSPVASQTQPAIRQIDTVYDEKSDRTTVSLAPTRISGPQDKYENLVMAPSFSFSGKQVVRPKVVDFELRSIVRGRLDTNLYVLFVIDGKEIFLSSNRGAIKHPVPGRVWMGERLVFRMPYETFVKLANAKSAEIRFDVVRFPISSQHQQALRELLR